MQFCTFGAVAFLSVLVGIFVLDTRSSDIPRQKISPVRSSARRVTDAGSPKPIQESIQPVINDEELAWCSRHSGTQASPARSSKGTPKQYVLRLPRPAASDSEKSAGRLSSSNTRPSLRLSDDCCNK
jgi:hypothetical protein